MTLIKLKYPIIVNDEQLNEINLPERLKLKHMKAMDKATGEVSKIAALIGAMAELPIQAIDQLDIEDFNVIAEVAGGFLAQSQGTGSK